MTFPTKYTIKIICLLLLCQYTVRLTKMVLPDLLHYIWPHMQSETGYVSISHSLQKFSCVRFITTFWINLLPSSFWSPFTGPFSLVKNGIMYLPSRRSVSALTWVLFVGVYCPHWFVPREINTNIKLPLTHITWPWRKHQDSREFLPYGYIIWIRKSSLWPERSIALALVDACSEGCIALTDGEFSDIYQIVMSYIDNSLWVASRIIDTMQPYLLSSL